jgi:dTDP-4-dehydrorhamnose 3,5-epimerase
MKIIDTNIIGCVVIEPTLYKDGRGIFFETFNETDYYKMFKSEYFTQDNVSVSEKNVLRGLHYQKGEYAQAKLVRVLNGHVQDVVVDCRKDSSSYGKVFTYVLDAKEYAQIYIPRGCAHGFLTLEDNTVFSYKVDNKYDKDSETGIMYNDPDLKINWFFGKDEELNISVKDAILPTWKDCYKFD